MSVFIDIKVFPQAGRQKLVVDKSGILKCFIVAAPEDGKANKEVIEFIAKLIGIKKQDIEIVSGLTSRKKRLVINSLATYEEFLLKAGLENQKTMF